MIAISLPRDIPLPTESVSASARKRKGIARICTTTSLCTAYQFCYLLFYSAVWTLGKWNDGLSEYSSYTYNVSMIYLSMIMLFICMYVLIYSLNSWQLVHYVGFVNLYKANSQEGELEKKTPGYIKY